MRLDYAWAAVAAATSLSVAGRRRAVSACDCILKHPSRTCLSALHVRLDKVLHWTELVSPGSEARHAFQIVLA